MKFKKTYAALIISIALFPLTVGAKPEVLQETGDFASELHAPKIPNKQISNVATYMSRQLKSFPKLPGCKVELCDDYIIKYSVKVSRLFAPNEFNLLNQATEYLAPILPFLRHYGKYKVILTMHTDYTGSEEYREILCDNRLLSLNDFFDTKIGARCLILSFAMSDTMPLFPNNSYKYRDENRRLEVYILPGPTFMDDFKFKK